jgi:3-deoxy-manno-octulosonate cytidylyltransferase (CMP-KDO synthetase)
VKPGDIILAPLRQADGKTKPRPVLVLRAWEPFEDLLTCGISSQLRHFVSGLDELIRPVDADFSASGLREESLFRLGFLGTIPPGDVRGEVGRVSPARLRGLLARLSAVFLPAPSPVRHVLGIIPARYASARFPGKPLHPIAGKPLIQHVVEQCKKAKSLREVIVATDDERIAAMARKFCRVEMTRAEHPSGSDRIAEVAARVACDAVINIQGDEPLIDPAVIDAVAGALNENEMSTAATVIRSVEEYDSPNVVKVVVSASGRALYFSRRTIPFVREAASRSSVEQLAAFPFLKHLGIYGYRRETLLRLVGWPVSPLEHAEKLEQLRALENGIQIAVVKVDYDSVGVDVPEDVARVEALLRRALNR